MGKLISKYEEVEDEDRRGLSLGDTDWLSLWLGKYYYSAYKIRQEEGKERRFSEE